KLFSLFTTLLLVSGLSAQVSMNMTLLDNWDDLTLPIHSGLKYNDCWGYTAPDGGEYAILGSAGEIHFIDITDPMDVVEVASFGNLNANGTSSLSVWRDFKTYDSYAYAVADQGTTNEGLIVFDLSELPATVTKVHQSTASFNRAHNVFIDEAKAKMYIPGSNTHNSGIIVFDLTNPAVPVEIAAPDMSGGYSHDIYVRNDTAYCFHGTSDMYVYDMVVPAVPEYLGSLTVYNNSGYNHSGWLTEDSKHLIFCDESSGRKVKVADLMDLSEISAPDSAHFFANLDNQSTLANIAHNPFVKGDYVYVAYYREGIQVWDISDPMNSVLEGYYDTNTNVNAGVFDGLWGVYPYFNSGTVIGSDTETGLYVMKVNSILPVELKEFSVVKNGKRAELNWTTAFERNNEGFEVHRSTDKENYTVIATVRGQGNSEGDVTYQTFDNSPIAGVNYYRLKQIDTDGEFEYSDVKSIEFAPEVSVNIYPTLVKKGEQITFEIKGVSNSDFTFIVTDIAGKLIEQGTVSRFSGNYFISTTNLSSGVYVVDLNNETQAFSQKILVE
ncbi:MAG: choice-of-anchor B domain-containing protein, partial [Saprospiraceae bacterium]